MSSQKCLKKLIDQAVFYLSSMFVNDARGNVHWKNARSPEFLVFSHTLSLKKKKNHQNNKYEN